MSCTEIYLNETYYLEALVTNSKGEPETGLTVLYEIRKSSDDSLINSGTLTGLGNGIYKTNFSFSEIDQFYILYNTPEGFTDEVETVLVRDNVLDSVETLVKRILGLSQENYRIINPTYNDNSLLTSATIRTFNNASDCNNNVNALAEYSMTAEYNSNGEMTSYKVVKA